MSYLDIVSYLKSERICVVSSLLQQGVMHVVQGGLVVLRVDLDTLDPDVLPEAQAHHVQVIATVAEGTRQLHKHCGTHIIEDVPSFITIREGKCGSFYDLTFSVSKVFCVQLDNTVCEVQTISYLLSPLYEYTRMQRRNVPTESTSDTRST